MLHTTSCFIDMLKIIFFIFFILFIPSCEVALRLTVNATAVGLIATFRKDGSDFDLLALVTKQNAVFNSADVQNVYFENYRGKWGTGYLNIRFPLPTLIHIGYSYFFVL